MPDVHLERLGNGWDQGLRKLEKDRVSILCGLHNGVVEDITRSIERGR